MKRLKRWAELQYERKMNALQKVDKRHPGQPVHPEWDYIAGQVAAYVEILEMLELLGQEE